MYIYIRIHTHTYISHLDDESPFLIKLVYGTLQSHHVKARPEFYDAMKLNRHVLVVCACAAGLKSEPLND